jgi:hypothetical protein
VTAVFCVAWPSEARAVEHTLCLDFPVGGELWDTSRVDAMGVVTREEWEEEGRDVAGQVSYPARRWLARVFDTGAEPDELVWGWQPLDGDGCATFDIDSTSTSLRVEWVRWAIWDATADGGADPNVPDTGNQVVAYECDVNTTTAASQCTFEAPRTTTAAASTTGPTQVTTEGLDNGGLLEIDIPMWCTSFSEERFAVDGNNPTTDSTVYLAVDPADPEVGPGEAIAEGTFSSRLFGSRPTVVLEGETAWRSKFEAAHEYGHTQTTLVNSALDEGDLNYNYTASGHLFDSQEWQAAAAVEGFADFYAVSVWHDVDLVPPMACINLCSERVYYLEPQDATNAQERRFPRSGGPVCEDDMTGMLDCADGVSSEWDWAVALWEYRQIATSPVDLSVMFQMLTATYNNQTWYSSGENDDFWSEFDQQMQSHLGSSYSDWVSAAQDLRLDR